VLVVEGADVVEVVEEVVEAEEEELEWVLL
jgi:hypothetical protein